MVVFVGQSVFVVQDKVRPVWVAAPTVWYSGLLGFVYWPFLLRFLAHTIGFTFNTCTFFVACVGLCRGLLVNCIVVVCIFIFV